MHCSVLKEEKITFKGKDNKHYHLHILLEMIRGMIPQSLK